jgi:hypothetical protein
MVRAILFGVLRQRNTELVWTTRSKYRDGICMWPTSIQPNIGTSSSMNDPACQATGRRAAEILSPRISEPRAHSILPVITTCTQARLNMASSLGLAFGLVSYNTSTDTRRSRSLCYNR